MRGAGSARQPAGPRDRGGGGLRGDPGGLLDLPGFGRWLSRRHRAAKVTAPKFQLVFNTVRDTPEWGCRRHPTRAPSALAKVNPPLAQPHGCFASQQAGEASPPAPLPGHPARTPAYQCHVSLIAYC